MNPAKTICVGGAALLAAELAFSQIKVAPPGSVKILPPPMLTNSVIINPNSSRNLEIKRPDEIPFSPPGIYLTRPFSGKVLVPGPMHDDISIYPQALPEPPIRIIRPNLTLRRETNSVPPLINTNLSDGFTTNKVVK